MEKKLNDEIIKQLEEDVNYRAEVDFYYCDFLDDEESVNLNNCHEDFVFAMDAILKDLSLELDEDERGDYYKIYQNRISSAVCDIAESKGYEYNGRDYNDIVWFIKINEEEDIEENDEE